jgi:dTDP-4-dehydrorhamnose 3,5-epimerase-like enzyme
VLFHFLVWGDFAQRWCSSPMKTLRGRHYSLKQHTQFTILNKVLDPLTSNINDSLTRATVPLPFTWMGWFCKNVMFSPMKSLRGRHYSLKQQTQFTMLNKEPDLLASIINGSITRDTVHLHSHERGCFDKSDVPHPWKHWEVGIIPLNRNNSQF